YNPNMFIHLQNYNTSKTEISQDKKIVLVEEPQKWVSKNDVNSNHVMELLHILHPHLNFLPMQARILMKTCLRIMKSDSMQLTPNDKDEVQPVDQIKQRQLQRCAQLTNAGALVPPANLPDFPIKNEQFEEIENFLTNRLAAVGGTGIDSLTRRILKYVLSNEVGMLFNWKGRDKKCFEKTALMKIIYGEGL
ncbi:hypothetical protein NQ314_021379, partial [Rhamnusium bicolor]